MDTLKKALTVGLVVTTMVWSMGVAVFVPSASAVTLQAGDLIKASGDAVYYYAADGKRYTFPTESTYMTWYPDFSTVKTITDDELAVITLAGNVVVRPGTNLVKITTVPKVYAVEPMGMLRHVDSEAAAATLWGTNWADWIIDIPDGFWPNYTDLNMALDGSEYPEGTLVRLGTMTAGIGVYIVDDAGEWNEFATQADFDNNWYRNEYVVTAPAAFPHTAGPVVSGINPMWIDVSQGGGSGPVGPVAPVGTLQVSLNPMTPASTTVPANATAAASDVPFTYIDFWAGAQGASIDSITVMRGGLSEDAAIDEVKLYDLDWVQFGNAQGLNSQDEAVFNNLGINLDPNAHWTVILAADMALTALYSGNIISLGLADASSVGSNASVTGQFPMFGNSMNLTDSVTIGTAILDDGALGTRNSTDLTVDPDDTDIRLTQVKIRAGSGEGLILRSMTAEKNGTAAQQDVKNIRLVSDDTGLTLCTKAGLDSSGRAACGALNSWITKGGNSEFSWLVDMNDSGAGRSIALDLHDGTDYTMLLEGDTFGFGVTPTRGTFCLANGTCTAQTINQGYLTGNLSVDSPPTGNVAVGDTQVPLLVVDYFASGETINVTSTGLDVTTTTALLNEVNNVTLYNHLDGIVAGPKDPVGAAPGTESMTFSDSYSVEPGLHAFTWMADMDQSMSTGDTVQVTMPVGGITAKGQSSGNSTFTTSGGATVPPAVAVIGKVQTLKGPTLDVKTAATPVASTFIANAQNVTLAYFDLDATAGGEDVKLTSLGLTQTLAGGAGATDFGNFELWGDPDNTDGVDEWVRIETTNSTETGVAGVNTFTFKVPVKVSKTEISRVCLLADLITPGTGTNTFHVASAGDFISTGWITNTAAVETVGANAGQSHSKAAAGSLKISFSPDRPSKTQLVAGSTGTSVMKYKLEGVDERVDVTEVEVAAAEASAAANVAAVKLYNDGVQIGSTSGYTFSSAAHVVLPSGTLVAPKDPENTTLEMKVDMAVKDNVSDSDTLEIGLGDSDGDDTQWGAAGAEAAGNYLVVATGLSSGEILAQSCINSTADDGVSAGTGCIAANPTGAVSASFVHEIYDGVLLVDANPSTPSGTATPGANKEAIRLDWTAVGDDITILDVEFTVGGTCVATGTTDFTLKSSDENTTYATWSGAAYFGVGADLGDFSVSVDADGGLGELTGWDSILEVANGATKTTKLFGDTNGCTTDETLQVSVDTGEDTTSGVAWENNEGNNIDVTTTDELPVFGGALVY